MTPKKPSTNERRLAKLLREMDGGDETPPNAWYQSSAAYLAKRGVRVIPRHEREFVDNYLQRMARIR
jgi:hypothetical protein